MDCMYVETRRLAVRDRVDLADQLVVVEDRKREVSPTSLLLRLVHLQRVFEIEQVHRTGPVVNQTVERRQQRGASLETRGGRLWGGSPQPAWPLGLGGWASTAGRPPGG